MTTHPSPFRCPVANCTFTGPNLTTHMAAEHSYASLMEALTAVTAGVRRPAGESEVLAALNSTEEQ
ncbi:hypothetical protein ACGFY7_23435 [Streptomyces prunicolor]|uniref:hypothetical protein n=1 Tax=Streptomyces prunicolor TaxID=67348 RepID=UPI00371C8E2A